MLSNLTKTYTQLMEYSYLLDLADECEDPYMRLMYAGMGLKCIHTQSYALLFLSILICGL